MAQKSTKKCTHKCPCEGCAYVGEADTELRAKFKVIAHQAAKHNAQDKYAGYT